MDYHKDRFEDYSLMVFKDEKLVAVLPANRVEDKLFSHQGLTYGGLVFSEKLKLKDVTLILKTILQFLEKAQLYTLNIKALPSIYSKFPNDELDYLLFILKAQLQRTDIYSVIDGKAGKISISELRKRGIKRAKNHSLLVKEQNVFEDFWNQILIPNLENTHQAKPTHSLQEIELLHQNFNANIRQFNVYKDESIIGGTTIFETNQVAHAQYISANKIGQELGALDVLFDTLINHIFKDKSYFSFGISNENQGQNINQGLLYWKESFGARSIAQNFYKIDTKNHTLLDRIFI